MNSQWDFELCRFVRESSWLTRLFWVVLWYIFFYFGFGLIVKNCKLVFVGASVCNTSTWGQREENLLLSLSVNPTSSKDLTAKKATRPNEAAWKNPWPPVQVRMPLCGRRRASRHRYLVAPIHRRVGPRTTLPRTSVAYAHCSLGWLAH